MNMDEIPWLSDAILSFYYSSLNIREVVEPIIPLKEGVSPIFKDWFHEIANLIILLSARTELSTSAMTNLLKFELMRYQLQAPYESSVMLGSGRQTSPLTSEDYARGMKTRLWSTATAVQLDQFRLLTNPNQEKNSDIKLNNNLKNFNVVSTPQHFKIANLEPVCKPQITQEEIWPDCFYIPQLRLQFMAKSKVDQRSIDSYMGGHGLRTSLSESAQLLAETLAGLIKKGNITEAIQIFKKAEIRKIQSGKTSMNPLELVDFSTNTMVATAETDLITGRWRDPLLSSSSDQLTRLETAFNEFCALEEKLKPKRKRVQPRRFPFWWRVTCR
jgi:hypothetical protein